VTSDKTAKSVIVDMETMFSPYLMASILAAQEQGAIADIHVPSTARFIEVWNHPDVPVPRTISPFESPLKILQSVSRFFEFSQDKVDPADPFLGMWMVRKAIAVGRVRLIDPAVYHKEVVEQLAAGTVYNDYYKKSTPAGAVTLNPDLVNVTLEGVLGWGLAEGIAPILGDQEFLAHFSNVATNIRLGRVVEQPPAIPLITQLEGLASLPNVEQLYKYATDKDASILARALLNSRAVSHEAPEKLRPGEIALEVAAIAVDHGTHTVLAGGSLLLYKVWNSIFARSS
jgi:hypothetical protein